MKYRAGVTPERPSNKRKSEYKQNFDWKNPVKSTPILTAQEVRNYIIGCVINSFTLLKKQER